MNNSSSGYHGHGRTRTSPSKKPSKRQCLSSSRALTVFLGTLVVVTVLVDTYFLASTDFRLKRVSNRFRGFTHHHQLQQYQHHLPVRASVTRPPWNRRKFKFEDNKNAVPELQRANSDEPSGREPILKIFQAAGIPPLNASMIEQLPTWEDVIKLIGPHPVVGGLDTCDAFKEKVPAVERMLGSSGMVSKWL